MKTIRYLQLIKKRDNYETPPTLYQAATLKYRIWPRLDVCASALNTKCREFITENQDSLLFDWKVPFFMNPPYSKIDKFIKKAFYESKKWKVDGLILTYSKTDTKWWHSYVENYAEVHFIRGRIKFFVDGYQTLNSAPYPSCWIVFRG